MAFELRGDRKRLLLERVDVVARNPRRGLAHLFTDGGNVAAHVRHAGAVRNLGTVLRIVHMRVRQHADRIRHSIAVAVDLAGGVRVVVRVHRRM